MNNQASRYLSASATVDYYAKSEITYKVVDKHAHVQNDIKLSVANRLCSLPTTTKSLSYAMQAGLFLISPSADQHRLLTIK